MARLSSCKGCGKQLQTEEKYIHGSKTYCAKCYEKMVRESEEYKQLILYICANFNIERPTGLMLKQIKEYKNEYSYTYGGIIYTLWYAKEILDKELISMYGISLVKYYYDDASRYYIQQDDIKKSMNVNGKVEIKTKIVRVNRINKNTQNNSLIDIGSLMKGGVTH